MTERQPSFWRHFTMAYEDAFRVVPTSWPAVLTIAAAVVVMTILSGLVGNFVGTRLGHGVLDVLVSAAIAWITAPYLIALYRAVATNQVTRRPETLRSAPETQRFAAWSALMAFIVGLPYVLYNVFGPEVPADQLTPESVNPGAALMILVASVAVWIFSVRTTTLMPMLALDPARASLPMALEQSRGRFWFIVGVLLVTMGPLLLGGIIVLDIVQLIAPILRLPAGAAVTALTQVVAIAVSTRLYQRYAAP